MFPTTIAGSLPKPAWLAEPGKLWPQWRLAGADLEAGKLDATLVALKLQEDAGVDVVCDGEQSRQHFVHGFLEFVEGIDFAHKVEMGIRNNRYKAMVPTVTGALKLKGRVHATEARFARAHTSEQLKITMPGPMTIIDTIADAHYGDRVKMAFAFADLLNAEARALERDGVDVIQFDEPAFNVYMNEVSTWGIEAIHRAIDGLKCATAVHICYGYGIKANVDWKATLGGEWRQYEEIFPALAASRISQVSVECRNAKVPVELLSLLKGKDVAVGVIDVATDADRNAGGRRRHHRSRAQARPQGAHRRLDQLRHGADAPRHRGGQARRARQGRGAGAATVWLENLTIARALAVDRAALLIVHLGDLPALAEHLLVLGAVHHGVDDVAAGALGCARHQLLDLFLTRRKALVGLLRLQAIVKPVFARRDPGAVPELLGGRTRASGKGGEQRQRRERHVPLPGRLPFIVPVWRPVMAV